MLVILLDLMLLGTPMEMQSDQTMLAILSGTWWDLMLWEILLERQSGQIL